MNAPTRLAFLGLAQKAIAAAAVGAMGIRFIEAAEAEIKKGALPPRARPF
ncbi:hypothetical protein [Bradyrhizobium sp. 200]|jgi:hypothetical protein|nr:hypothetical protein [Bradyrhizobium sp. 200]